MGEIRHQIRLPDSLLESPYNNEAYGQFDTFPQANPIYNHGWFSGYVEDIHSLPRAVKADYLLELAGGADKVLCVGTAVIDELVDLCLTDSRPPLG